MDNLIKKIIYKVLTLLDHTYPCDLNFNRLLSLMDHSDFCFGKLIHIDSWIQVFNLAKSSTHRQSQTKKSRGQTKQENRTKLDNFDRRRWFLYTNCIHKSWLSKHNLLQNTVPKFNDAKPKLATHTESKTPTSVWTIRTRISTMVKMQVGKIETLREMKMACTV